jgi:hypothetical protein
VYTSLHFFGAGEVTLKKEGLPSFTSVSLGSEKSYTLACYAYSRVASRTGIDERVEVRGSLNTDLPLVILTFQKPNIYPLG